MSHIVTVQTKVHNPAVVAAACRRLQLEDAVQGTAQLFSGEATCLLVKLPGWQYPVVIDTLSGTLRMENYWRRMGRDAMS